MPAIFEYPHVVAASEIDALGHAGNLCYLHWALDAALAHSAAQGWSAEDYHRLGAGFVVRSHQIQYLRPAVEGDAVIVRTWVAGFRRATSLRRYEILRASDRRMLAKAATDWAFIHFASGRPRRIPPEIAAAFPIVPDDDAGHERPL